MKGKNMLKVRNIRFFALFLVEVTTYFELLETYFKLVQLLRVDLEMQKFSFL